ncbi:hypothetical protein VTO42DRAFT_5432 [Malbranchea cinnamomea]
MEGTRICGIKIWPIRYWRIVLLFGFSWQLLRWFARKLPGWIRWTPTIIMVMPELVGILMENLQVKRHIRDGLVCVVLTPVYWLSVVVVVTLSPWRTLKWWWKNARAWVQEKPRRAALMRALQTADTYEEWLETADLLDKSYGTDKWRRTVECEDYDYNDISIRVRILKRALQQDDIRAIARIVRSGLTRNMVNIAEPVLYDKAFAGTKLIIEEYADLLGAGIRHVTAIKTAPRHPRHHSGYDVQAQLDFLRQCRQGFGRSSLVFQGGALFGFSHLGVAKALYLRGLLPRVITGSGSGALAAALVCTRTDDELLSLFKGEGVDLSVLKPEERAKRRRRNLTGSEAGGSLARLFRRLALLLSECCCVDLGVLEECARVNIGDMTFEEAYMRTKRVLSITLPIPRKWDRRNMMNHLQTPYILIRSAIVASNVKYSPFQPITLLAKNPKGAIVPYKFEQASFGVWLRLNYEFRENPLYRLSSYHNVNHFIVSQARPFIVPIFYKHLHCPGDLPWRKQIVFPTLLKQLREEIRHRLLQLDIYGLIPQVLYRVLLDEDYPNLSLVILPQLSIVDYIRSFINPIREDLRHWIRRGERGTWPAMSSIKVRTVLEVELEKGFQVYQRFQDNRIWDPLP